ncbi:bicyclomycin resistance protein, partial [Vibrio parahaemolyticus AQ3810]
YQVMLRGL